MASSVLTMVNGIPSKQAFGGVLGFYADGSSDSRVFFHGSTFLGNYVVASQHQATEEDACH